jgi:hypothetical protein
MINSAWSSPVSNALRYEGTDWRFLNEPQARAEGVSRGLDLTQN